ncbi:MAG TPA: hypothetical protein VF014_06020 [Casimicrobiaceae bacterium]|nr:hypothetical protein [Casimicrobiaceae bacterium]
MAIKEILVSGDLAVVRLVWTLKATGSDMPGEVVSEEPGMDVFRKQPDGGWKITRYIAYVERRLAMKKLMPLLTRHRPPFERCLRVRE